MTTTIRDSAKIDNKRRKALAEYGHMIKAKGSRAGEPIIRKYEKKFPDFRRLAYAVGIMLRTDELLKEHIAACAKMPKLIKATVNGKTTKAQKATMIGHMMECLPCVDRFKVAIEKKGGR